MPVTIARTGGCRRQVPAAAAAAALVLGAGQKRRNLAASGRSHGRERDALFSRPIHAHVILIVLGRELRTVEGRRPGESEFLQHRLAARANRLAQRSARPDRNVHLLRAHGHVNGAQEELQLTGAAVLDERRESLQLQLGVFLQIVAHQVGHGRLAVADAATKIQLDRLTGAHIFRLAPAQSQAQRHHHQTSDHFTTEFTRHSGHFPIAFPPAPHQPATNYQPEAETSKQQTVADKTISHTLAAGSRALDTPTFELTEGSHH